MILQKSSQLFYDTKVGAYKGDYQVGDYIVVIDCIFWGILLFPNFICYYLE